SAVSIECSSASFSSITVRLHDLIIEESPSSVKEYGRIVLIGTSAANTTFFPIKSHGKKKLLMIY
ncbi:hypothetical protein, partial [Selenomonas noxia]